MTCLTVIVPACNEAAGLAAFQRRLAGVLDALDLTPRVLYVDDGSDDGTWALINGFADADPRVGGLRLSRRFGKEAAVTAGLDHAGVGTDAVVILDADLQDPPELIPELVAQWRAGFDVVHARRVSRHGDGRIRRLSAAAFYRLMERVADTRMPRDSGEYCLLSARAVAALGHLRERQRYMKGLFGWIGYPQTAISYRRAPRHAGSSKWPLGALWRLAVEGLTSFSSAPLRLATWVGLAASLLAFGFGAWVLAKALLWGDPVQGYPSLMLTILFLGGVQLLALGVIGEYLGRVYAESKQRPIYYIEGRRPPQPATNGATLADNPNPSDTGG